ncbi:MAG: hypothetical protein QGF74_01590 [Candidatus Nanoarchaeia archaeon]|jgi:hypothetical protein|nr:hypothetical protein [Candidatus Nanoarchaeia archaeon]|tara:strand:- start:564 stop:824 length:261 start_codon:yes stop_codon:yes gene_type:complete
MDKLRLKSIIFFSISIIVYILNQFFYYIFYSDFLGLFIQFVATILVIIYGTKLIIKKDYIFGVPLPLISIIVLIDYSMPFLIGFFG